MHLLIILLQQLLGMLPGAKQVPQAEVVRKGGNPTSGEPDACGSITKPLRGWMTPFETFHSATSQPVEADRGRWRSSLRRRRVWPSNIAASGAPRPWRALIAALRRGKN